MEMNISKEYNLEQFQTVMYDTESDNIYLIANKLDGQLGFYILNIIASDPYPGGAN